MAISHDEVRKALHYNPLTGVFTWTSPRKKIIVGSVAGTVRKDGRRVICLCRQWYLDSRLAWFWMLGVWPINEIDHKDRDPSNCCWENLREATSREQKFNRKVKKDNKLGVRGVSAHPSGYRARGHANGKRYELGLYPTVEEAAAAYNVWAKKVHGEFYAGPST